MIRSFARNALAGAVQRDWFWRVLKRCLVTPARFAEEQRWLLRDLPELRASERECLNQLCSERRVLSGPFVGLEYPVDDAAGSSLLPKLLGTYEKELHPWVEEICARPYTDIVNLGAGEGYYAVGLALRMPQARVFALDPNPRARQLCTAMARRNGVADRVEVRGTATAREITRLPKGARALLVCDCEGYEQEVLSAEHASRFSAWDILVETHDQLDFSISVDIKRAFAASHRIESTFSLDDIQKVHAYRLDILEGIPAEVRKVLLAESRGYVMEWLWLESHRSDSSRRRLNARVSV